MNKKMTFGNLFHRPPPAISGPSEEQAQEIEKLDRELKTAEPETRFRESVASGKIDGDIITVDKNGEVVRKSKNTNIFDL